jgi:predicted O-methyltransferase YrrM
VPRSALAGQRERALTETSRRAGLLRRLARVGRDPAGAWERFYDRLDRKREYARAPCVYNPEPDWEACLHQQIGLPWPCPLSHEFAQLWPKIGEIIVARGYRFGPESFYGYNDGDPELARAIWCLIRHLQPRVVVETGVAHGVTTRVILEALERNRQGRLWSIDLVPAEEHMAAQIGIAAEGFAPERWRLMPGSSRRVLPGLLAELGRIDLFVHDSLHTRRNVCFEVDWVRRALRPGGFVVIDDIDTNWGFDALRSEHPEDSFLICQSVPVSPDLRRFDGKGLFGVIQPKQHHPAV